MNLESTFNFAAEEERLKKQLQQIENGLQKMNQRLQDRSFLDRAPKDVIQREKEKKEEALQKREKILRSLEIVRPHLSAK